MYPTPRAKVHTSTQGSASPLDHQGDTLDDITKVDGYITFYLSITS